MIDWPGAVPMGEPLWSQRYNPCKGCPDRYPACSGKCEKPGFLAWKAEQEKIKQARAKYDETTSYTVDQVLKNRRT